MFIIAATSPAMDVDDPFCAFVKAHIMWRLGIEIIIPIIGGSTIPLGNGLSFAFSRLRKARTYKAASSYQRCD